MPVRHKPKTHQPKARHAYSRIIGGLAPPSGPTQRYGAVSMTETLTITTAGTGATASGMPYIGGGYYS